jgi:hypothetical protein
MTVWVPPKAIHEALLDDEALAALPSWLARAAGARSAMIQWRHPDGVHEVMAFSHHAPACAALYAWKYAPLDPWLKVALASPRRGELMSMAEHVPMAALEKSRFYREFIRRSADDTVHAAVAVFDSAHGHGLLSLHRGRGEPAFGRLDLAPLTERLLHLGCIIRARGELIARRRREQVKRDDLDGVALGGIVVRGDGQVVQVNLAADQVLRRADGFRTSSGRLCCIDPGSRFRLQAALALATAPDNAMATAITVERAFASPRAAERRAGPLAYVVSVTPLRGEHDAALARLVFRDPDVPEDSLTSRLRALFRPGRGEPALANLPNQGLVCR